MYVCPCVPCGLLLWQYGAGALIGVGILQRKYEKKRRIVITDVRSNRVQRKEPDKTD